MKISRSFTLAVVALATFTGCSTPERTTTEETTARTAAPAMTSTQVIRSY